MECSKVSCVQHTEHSIPQIKPIQDPQKVTNFFFFKFPALHFNRYLQLNHIVLGVVVGLWNVAKWAAPSNEILRYQILEFSPANWAAIKILLLLFQQG